MSLKYNWMQLFQLWVIRNMNQGCSRYRNELETESWNWKLDNANWKLENWKWNDKFTELTS